MAGSNRWEILGSGRIAWGFGAEISYGSHDGMWHRGINLDTGFLAALLGVPPRAGRCGPRFD